MMIYQLAEKFNTPNPQDIADLPANVLLHWIAYFRLNNQTKDNNHNDIDETESDDINSQCASVMRILSNE